MDLQTQHTGVRAPDAVKVVIATGNAVIEQYRTYCKTDGEMIGAMAQTIAEQRNRLMAQERKIQELQKGRTT